VIPSVFLSARGSLRRVRLTKGTLLVIGAAVLAVAAGGGAIAATKLNDPKATQQAIITDAAGQLGVTPAKLSAALKQAVENQIDAMVKAGTITKAQGDALKARVEAGDLPLFAGPHRGFGGPGGFDHHGGPFARGLDAAATYLGMTEDQLHQALEGGKTLAQVAKDKGKTVDGLVTALTNDAKQKLNSAVTNGRLTQAQADQMLKDLQSHITDLVNGTLPKLPDRDHFEHRGFFRGGAAMPHPPAFRHA
jgi:polyhydroxyalkanoate synthesis regulator phasin